MRGVYYLLLVAPLTAVVPLIPASVHAAPSTSSADRARIALLVYQSQSARQADLRRGDAATRDLRAKAARAEKLAAATRAELAKARADGARAKKQSQLLEQRLEQQERELAEAAEKYTAELAKRDEEYARERSILISTGERLLSTPEGRRVLDLYNAGGQENWNEARQVLDEARRTRRALDNRDAAKLYFEAYRRGLETNDRVTALYEEVVRDDPSIFDDWLNLQVLYTEAGKKELQRRAANQLSELASDDITKFEALRAAAGSHSDSTTQEAQADFDAAIQFAVALVRSSPSRQASQMAGLAFWEGAHPFLVLEKWEEARKRLQQSIVHLKVAQTPGKIGIPDYVLVNALVGLGKTFHNVDAYDVALSYYEQGLELSRMFVEKDPTSMHALDVLYMALEARGIGYFAADNFDDAYKDLSEARLLAETQRTNDPSVIAPIAKLIESERWLGMVESKRGNHAQAIGHLSHSLSLISEYFDKDKSYLLNSLEAGRSLADAYARAGDKTAAMAQYRRTIEHGRKVLVQMPESEIAIEALAGSLLGVGENMAEAGRQSDARSSLLEAEKLIEAGLGLRPKSEFLLEVKGRAEKLRSLAFAPSTSAGLKLPATTNSSTE